MTRTKSLFFIFLLTAFLPTLAMSAQVVDKIVAFVDDTPITQSELREAMRTDNIDPQTKLPLSTKKRTQDQVLEDLINEKILEAELENKKIEITDTDVENAIQNMATQNHTDVAGFRTIVAQHGLSFEKYKEGLKTNLKKQEFIKQVIYPKIHISDYDLQQYYDKHKDDFSTFDKIRFSEILLTSDSVPAGKDLKQFAGELVNTLRKGGDFALSAKIYSHGPFANDGGDSGLLETSQLRPDIVNILLPLKLNTISDPIASENTGFFIFKVVERSTPKIRPFNDVREALRQQFGDKEIKDELERFTMEARAHHYIEIR